MPSELLAHCILEVFADGVKNIWQRFPNLSKALYGSVFLISFLYFWLFDEMAWWSAAIFAIFLALIFATLLILLLYLGVRLCYKRVNFKFFQKK